MHVYTAEQECFTVCQEKDSFLLHSRKINPGHKTPTVPILVTGVFILFCVLSGAIRVVSVIANFVFFPLWLVIGIASFMNLTNIKNSGRSYKEAIPFYVPGGRFWAGITIVISIIFTIITFLSTDDVVIGGGIAVAFFVICWVYYVWWKGYNKKQGIDIVKEAEKYRNITYRILSIIVKNHDII